MLNVSNLVPRKKQDYSEWVNGLQIPKRRLRLDSLQEQDFPHEYFDC
jgi:hypothetical protein